MLYTIYQITHRESGKCYIGKHQTNDLNDGYMGSGHLIRRAIQKHGKEAFHKEVLHVFSTEEEMNEKEKELVTSEFCLREDNYNLCPGGQGGWGYVNASGKAVNINQNVRDRLELSRLGNEAKAKKKQDNPDWHKAYKGKLSAANKRLVAEGKHPFQNLSKPANLGKVWITDGQLTRKINSGDETPIGWRLGRI